MSIQLNNKTRLICNRRQRLRIRGGYYRCRHTILQRRTGGGEYGDAIAAVEVGVVLLCRVTPRAAAVQAHRVEGQVKPLSRRVLRLARD